MESYSFVTQKVVLEMVFDSGVWLKKPCLIDYSNVYLMDSKYVFQEWLLDLAVFA